MLPDVGESFSHVAEHGAVLGVGGGRARGHGQHRGRGDGEGEGVEREGRADAGDLDQHSADGGAGEPQGDRAHELVERVGLGQLPIGDDVGHDRVEGGAEERVAGGVGVTSATSCQSSSAPASESAAIAPTARARIRSAATISRRRSKRSLRTPPRSRSTSVGTVMATPTMARAVGAFDSA